MYACRKWTSWRRRPAAFAPSLVPAGVPIVALTAHAFAEQVTECQQAGMESHLAKPFTPEALLRAVEHAVTIRQARQANIDVDTAPAHGAGCVMPAIGSEPAVLDLTAFERTAAFLSSEAVVSYLRTLAEQAESLLKRLREPDALARTGVDLAAAAHKLAGSAGMFGFERLARVARRFEHAALSGTPDTPTLADQLGAAIDVSLREMLTRGQTTS